MLIVKVMHGAETPGPDGPCSLYGDVSSVHFPSERGQPLKLYQREPVKTALVGGFVESERFVDIDSAVYVLNENGRTISSFRWPEPAVK